MAAVLVVAAVMGGGAELRAQAPASDGYTDTRKKAALLIAAGDYQHQRLPKLSNPKHDIAALASRLRELGFAVRTSIDQPIEDLRATIRAFAEDSQGADIGFVYISSHGIQINGENYVLPVDFVAEGDDPKSRLLSVNALLGQIDAGIKAKILMLDACRNNPMLDVFQAAYGTRSVGAGMANITWTMPANAPQAQPHGLIVGYATQPNTVALDGPAGTTSP